MRPRRQAKSKSNTINQHLAALSANQRAALQQLREAIRAAAPRAEECISYDIPAFRLDGKLLVAFGAWKNHCAFYPGSVVDAFKAELRDYATSKGTIRFPPDRPLPAALVRKLVNTGIARNAARYSGRSGSPVRKNAPQ